MIELSRPQARRAALAAQGFTDPRPTGRVDRRHVRRVFDRIGLIQIDSVNVLVRSQELPLFARLGPHPRDLLPKMAADGELFEYWAHEASLLPVATLPWFREQMRTGLARWPSMQRLAVDQAELVEQVRSEVEARGPIAASDFEGRAGKSGPWWGWDHTKRALEILFYQGAVSARRRGNFEREYDLLHRMLPAAHVDAPPLTDAEARREMIVRAAQSHGVGTVGDLCDYYRLNVPKSRPLFEELVEDGRLVRAEIEGWKGPVYADPDLKVPRTVRARALLSPFDSVVWNRDRTERLFDFRYRIEIYVPAPKRVYGYYVLPFLLGDRLVARVDLKSDRQASVLRVRGAYGEDPLPSPEVADALAAELTSMAEWLGLAGVEVELKGDLAAALRAAVS